ncbi:hypothetical protein H0G86_003219 [Trichoderma simmonsii]|uniref:Uncharacterized protein n=1 Tax=Trichoderma simmonsii TaxID=1491479 RepID=A0A8G0L7A2_9HYPO|nr:hypothetical protein H0G86_003219 [Trichoderma simmonsii]
MEAAEAHHALVSRLWNCSILSSVPNASQYAMPRRDEKYHRHGPSTVPKDADDGGERLQRGGQAQETSSESSGTAKHILSWLSHRNRRCYQPLAQTQLGMTGSADERKRLGGDQRAACFVSRGAGVTRRLPD